MTPPRPTAPTAAELRERFVRKLEVHLASLSAAADAREDLDRLMAAVRAEALEDAARVCDGIEVKALADACSSAAMEWYKAEANDRSQAAGAHRCVVAIRALVSK